MEEEILKILIQSLQQPFNEEVCEEIASKEIADTVERFADWKDNKLSKGYISYGDKTYYLGGLMYSFTDLFTYWLEHINK